MVMRWYAILPFAVPFACHAEFSGQHVSDKGTGVVVQEHAIGHVEQGALQAKVEPGAVNIPFTVHPGTLHVEVKDGALRPVVHTPITTTVADGAVRFEVKEGALKPTATFNVAEKAVDVNIPLTAHVADGAMRLNVNLNVAEGAVQIRGVEKGAVQTDVKVPWYFWIAPLVFAALWLVTKLRKRDGVRSMEPAPAGVVQRMLNALC